MAEDTTTDLHHLHTKEDHVDGNLLLERMIFMHRHGRPPHPPSRPAPIRGNRNLGNTIAGITIGVAANQMMGGGHGYPPPPPRRNNRRSAPPPPPPGYGGHGGGYGGHGGHGGHGGYGY